MDERERMMILLEILDERYPYVQNMLNEWATDGADALSYAQAKDLVWQLLAPLGISLIGYRAAERALDDYPSDPDAREAYERFTAVGQQIGDTLDDALNVAHSVRS